jgi:hypothetical protein
MAEAYGQTDVWSDPRWLRNTAQGHGQLARQAQERLQELQQEAARGQQGAQFTIAHRDTEADRAERREASRLAHEDQMAAMRQRMAETQAYHKTQAEQTAETTAGRRNLDLLNLAQSPTLTAFGKQAPAIQKALIEQFYARTQGGGAAMGGPAGAATLAALGGGSAVAPETEAVRNYRQSKGIPVAPRTEPSTTNAPAGVPQRGNVVGVPQQGGGDFAPSTLMADTGMYPPGTYPSGTDDQTPMIGGSPAIPSNRLIQHGQIYNGPPGYDLNINTGEWVPTNRVGTINGRPATQVIAEGALKRGVSPEDTRSREVYNTMRQYPGMAATPPIDIPIPNPAELPGVSAEPQVAAGGGGASQRGAVSRFFAPPGSGLAHLFGLDEGVAPIVQTPTAPAPAPAPATNRPLFMSPELANATTTEGASKPQGPPPTIDIDKFLSQHIGGPSMEDLQRRQGLLPPQPPPTVNKVPIDVSISGRSNQAQDVGQAASAPIPPTPAAVPPVYRPTNPERPAFHPANVMASAHNMLTGATPPPNVAPPPNVMPQISPEQLEAQRRADEMQRRRALY